MRFKKLDDRQALFALVDNFAEQMKARLDEMRERKHGWDDFSDCPTEALQVRLLSNAAHLRDTKSMIDVANFAAFLWNRV